MADPSGFTATGSVMFSRLSADEAVASQPLATKV